MFFSSWLRKQNAKPRTNGRATSSFRPQLEVLEGRDVPSTLTAANSLDDGSAGSLRAEIAAAHSGDTIVFDATLAGTTIQLTSGELVINKNLTIQGPETISGGGYNGSRRAHAVGRRRRCSPRNGPERRWRPQVRETLWLLFLPRRVSSLARVFEVARSGTRVEQERTASTRQLTLDQPRRRRVQS